MKYRSLLSLLFRMLGSSWSRRLFFSTHTSISHEGRGVCRLCSEVPTAVISTPPSDVAPHRRPIYMTHNHRRPNHPDTKPQTLAASFCLMHDAPGGLSVHLSPERQRGNLNVGHAGQCPSFKPASDHGDRVVKSHWSRRRLCKTSLVFVFSEP